MKLDSVFHVLGQNMAAAQGRLDAQLEAIRRPLLCWQCQKEKKQWNGKYRLMGRQTVFVCAGCVAANQERKKVQA